MAKKDFKQLGAIAVDKFLKPTQDTLNTPVTQHTPNTQDTLNTQDTPSTQHTPNTQDTQSTQHTPVTQHTPNTQKTKRERVQNRARINLAFDDTALDYLQVISRLDGKSITRYINDLIHQDARKREDEYEQAKRILKRT